MKWLSFHIYLDSNWQSFLQYCISPSVEKLTTNKLIDNYFYILYSEKGNHIRLRLQTISQEITIIETIKSEVLNYLSANPSPIEPNRPIEFYPTDSFHIIPYLPEYNRYGGVHGIEISQIQFQYSSNIVFRYLNHGALKTNSSILNCAFKVHITTAWVYCNGSVDEAILFFRYIYCGRIFTNDRTFLKLNKNYEISYSQLFNQQKNILIPFVRSIWHLLNNDGFIDLNIGIWKENEIRIRDNLFDTFQNGKLEIFDIFENYPIWNIVDSYVHMMNNRMGVTTSDESLIAYFIMRSLIEM